MRIMRILKLSLIYVLILIIHILSGSTVAMAGFDDLVRDVFPSGTMSNITRSSLVKEQQAGHLLGGSVIVKSPTNPKLQLITARAPSCKLGGLPCGAQIEALGGGVSLVSSKELMHYLKKLPAGAATYGSFMAVKTLCPQCENLMEYLDAKADWLNQFSLDGCKTMQSLMDPVFPKQQAKDQALRQSRMLLTGDGKDMSYWQSESRRSDNEDPTAGVEQLESQISDNYNLVWKALSKKSGGMKDGKEFRELLMSISGTIIGTKDEAGRVSVKHLKSLVNRDLIKQMIGADGVDSNKMRIYACEDAEKCLKAEAKEMAVGKGSFLFQRVEKIVGSITEKVLKNAGSLTAEEEMIVSLSTMPLILKIEMDLANYSSKANAIANQTEYVEALSYDVVTSYLQSLLVEVQESVSELGAVQIGDRKKFESFEKETRETMRMLSRERIEARGRFDLISKSRARLRQDVDKFNKSFEDFIGNHSQ